MSTPWQIIGQAGATLNDTPRTLQQLRTRSATLSYASLAADTLTWSVATDDATGSPSILPDAGQVVSLWRAGVRHFSGIVTRPKIGLASISVTAEGPWWWMEQIPLTSTQTDATGAPAQRTSLVLPTGSHATKISTVITRMIAEGVPVQLGTIDAMYDTPQMTLSEMSCAQALVELMKWVPDAVAVMDHSTTSGTGHPTLSIRRRGTMSSQTYTIGTDAVESVEIEPRIELQVAAVEITNVSRTADGTPQFGEQTSGTPAPARTQRITVSGPEIVPFLPPDSFTRIPIYAKTTSITEALTFQTKELQSLLHTWPTAGILAGAWTDPYGITSNRAVYMSGNEGWEFVRQTSGDPVYASITPTIPSGRTAVILGLAPGQEPPEWLLKAGLARLYIADYAIQDGNGTTSDPVYNVNRRRDIQSALRPDIRGSHSNLDGTGNGTPIYSRLIRQVRSDTGHPIWTLPTASVPATLQSGAARSSTSATQIQLATAASSQDGAYVGEPVFWTRAGVRHGAFISAYAGATRVATLAAAQPADIAPQDGNAYILPGSFISPADYDYLVPPAGLAAGLLAAQSWLPWAGPITLANHSGPAPNLLDRKFRLAGGPPAPATMDALARRVTYALDRGRLTIDLGAPARTDFGSLSSRVRRQAKDSIVVG